MTTAVVLLGSGGGGNKFGNGGCRRVNRTDGGEGFVDGCANSRVCRGSCVDGEVVIVCVGDRASGDSGGGGGDGVDTAVFVTDAGGGAGGGGGAEIIMAVESVAGGDDSTVGVSDEIGGGSEA